jgi:XRE family transcriptional regulator, regulator of sulfur utilization
MAAVRRTPMIGAELREVRVKRGVSARMAAAQAGLSPSALTSIERGERYPTLETLEALAECYGIRIVITPTDTHLEAV